MGTDRNGELFFNWYRNYIGDDTKVRMMNVINAESYTQMVKIALTCVAQLIGCLLQTERSPVPLSVRSQAWMWLLPGRGTGGHPSLFLTSCVSPFLPPFPSL